MTRGTRATRPDNEPGAMVFDALDKYGWTQRQLASAIGVSHHHINRMIRGREPFSPSMAVRIERVLPPLDALELSEAQLPELIKKLRGMAAAEASENALEQPAMFEMGEVT